MVEEQPQARCPYCGFPVNTKEHSPDCPNAGKNKAEVDSGKEQVDQPENKELRTQEVLETLNPEKITDVEGVERNVYNFTTKNGQEIKVVFYSKEELPFNEEFVKDRQGFVIGEKPYVRSDEEWNTFLSSIRQASEADISPTALDSREINESRSKGKASFFVENNPQALLDLAFHLGVEGKELREIRKKMAYKEITDESEEMMDKVIAAKILDDNGEYQSERNMNGEALLLLALQGDEHAENILQQRLEQLKKKDEEREKRQIEELHQEPEKRSFMSREAEPLDIDKLVAVHATRFRPKPSTDSINIKTTFDGTDWNTPRNTIHFSMNHHVSSHMYGNWMDTPYVALSPLRDVIKKNGKPMGVNTVDTYFELSPGRNLALPKENARLVMPGKIDHGELFQYENNDNVSYQLEKINEQDVEALFKRYGDTIEDIESDIWSAIENTLRYPPESDDIANQFDYEKQTRLASELHSYLSDQTRDKDTIIYIMELLRTNSTREAIETIVRSAGLTEEIPKKYLDYIERSVDGTIRNNIKLIAVKDLIEKMGFENHRGGSWAWDGDDFDATRRTAALAKKMGTNWGAHSGHPTSKITEEYYHEIGTLKDGEQDIVDYRNSVTKLNSKHFDNMTPAIRRMLYLRGLI